MNTVSPLLIYVLIAVVSYLLGSLSPSIFISSHFFGGDVRGRGSGNAGATNMARVFGMLAGVATLLADMAKTGLAVFLGHRLMGDTGLCTAGIACMVGHCFPVFHKFKGGKGISAGAAIGFAIDWRVGLTILAVFLLVALLSKKVSLGSVCAAVAITAASLAFHVSTPKLVLAVVGMILAVFQHRSNIARLLAGTEADFRPGKAK